MRGRKVDPGIGYYRMKCDHVHNRKIKLLFNEFDSDGYWIWQCLLSTAYGTYGYYFDCNDEDSFVLFATDVCKKKVSLVKEVIAGCIRRDLFDKNVFDMFGVLTSEMMQEDYLVATYERRKKTSVIEIKKDYLLIDISPDERNIQIITGENELLPGEIEILPGTNSQSRVEKRRKEKSRGEEEEKPPKTPAPFGHSDTYKSMDDVELVCLEESTIWQESMMKMFSIKNFEEIKIWIRDFFEEMRASGQDKRMLSDAKSHCYRWIKIQIEKEKEKSSAQKEKETAGEPERGVAAAQRWANVERRPK